MYSVSQGSTELLKTLISAGADVNTEDKEGGSTALMYFVSEVQHPNSCRH